MITIPCSTLRGLGKEKARAVAVLQEFQEKRVNVTIASSPVLPHVHPLPPLFRIRSRSRSWSPGKLSSADRKREFCDLGSQLQVSELKTASVAPSPRGLRSWPRVHRCYRSAQLPELRARQSSVVCVCL